MDAGDWIALCALLVAALALVVSSVISARAAGSASRSAAAAESAAQHAGESVGVAREQLALNREMRDDQDAPTFRIELTAREQPGQWLLRASMTGGPAVLDVDMSYSGRASYQRPPGVQRVTPIHSAVGEIERETVGDGGAVAVVVRFEEHIQRLSLRVVLVFTELLDIEEPATPRTWTVVCQRVSTRGAGGDGTPRS